MTSSIQNSGEPMKITDIMDTSHPKELLNLTKIVDRKAKTSIEKILNHEAAKHLKELDGIPNLETIYQNTFLLSESRDEINQNILHYSILNEDLAMTKFIIYLAPKLLIESDDNGHTPLYLAVTKNQKNSVEWLLDPSLLGVSDGSDPQTYDPKTKNTPLHEAVWNGYKEIAVQLKNYGASLDSENSVGLTAGDLARYRVNAFDYKNGKTADVLNYRWMEENFVPKRGLLSFKKICEKIKPVQDTRQKA